MISFMKLWLPWKPIIHHREHGFFSKFEGSVGGKKEENKKKSPIFCVGFDYQ